MTRAQRILTLCAGVAALLAAAIAPATADSYPTSTPASSTPASSTPQDSFAT